MSLVFRKHALLKPPSIHETARMDPGALKKLHEDYHEAIENAERDPYRYGYELPNWKVATDALARYDTLLLLGANRSGKTQFSARKIVKSAIENPNSLIFCFSQTSETSLLVQQPAIFEALPIEMRLRADGKPAVSYTKKNGFSDAKFVMENGTQIVFKTYTQWQQNDQILEGMELGCAEPKSVNIGAWCDEYLLGMGLLDRLILRLATHDAKLILSFTPKDGETETVKNYRNGAKTLERRHVSAGLKSPQSVPYVQYNEVKDTGIVYFHAIDNPWSGYGRLLKDCIGKADDNYTLTALYGVPTKSAATLFPRFNENVNVVPRGDIPTTGVTRYCIADPAGTKPWFITWISVDALDTWWIYREWPGYAAGDWAEEKNGKWAKGPACRERLGWGCNEYHEEITTLEGDEKIFMRLIDPRAGETKYSRQGGGQSNYMIDMDDLGMVFVAAPGGQEGPGLQMIQNKLAYNTAKPIDAQNRPRLMVSEDCPNIIRAFQEYDGSSLDHPWKDPIDTVRYAAVEEIRYVDPKSINTKNSKKGGY